MTVYQDPLYETYLEAEVFERIYTQTIASFDGENYSATLNDLMTGSPLNQNIRIFIDQDARDEFLERAQSLGEAGFIMEAMIGEPIEDRKKRLEQERECALAKERLKAEAFLASKRKLATKSKKEVQKSVKDTKNVKGMSLFESQILASIEALRVTLSKELDPTIKSRLQAKINRALEKLSDRKTA